MTCASLLQSQGVWKKFVGTKDLLYPLGGKEASDLLEEAAADTYSTTAARDHLGGSGTGLSTRSTPQHRRAPPPLTARDHLGGSGTGLTTLGTPQHWRAPPPSNGT